MFLLAFAVEVEFVVAVVADEIEEQLVGLELFFALKLVVLKILLICPLLEIHTLCLVLQLHMLPEERLELLILVLIQTFQCLHYPLPHFLLFWL